MEFGGQRHSDRRYSRKSQRQRPRWHLHRAGRFRIHRTRDRPSGFEYLEISVRSNSADPFTTLTPRQLVTSAPYATIASVAQSASTATTATNAGNADNLGNIPASSYLQANGNGSALTNLNASSLTLGVVPIAHGGTGSSTQNFVDLFTNQSIGGNKTFTGALSGNILGTVKWNEVTATSQQAVSNNGYVTNSASEVTITLPASPNVGDIIAVTGGGSGGWKIAQNAGQKIFIENAALRGTVWIPRESIRTWLGVASSADGTKLVAVAFGGQIYTSTNSGVSWTARESNRYWYAVASSADGAKLVAVVQNGQIYTSTNSGVSWTARESSRNWFAVASSADGTKLIAADYGGQIYTSADSGVTWTASETSRGWTSVASSASGNDLVAVAYPGQIYISPNAGSSWIPVESNRNWFAVASSTDGHKLVAVVNSGQIYTSADSGGSWTPHESSRLWHSVASSADGTTLVAVDDGGQIYISTDSGANWAPRETDREWRSVASSADGLKLVAAVQDGQIYTSDLAYTTPGTGGSLHGVQYSIVELQHVGGGTFLILHSVGKLSVF